jgi:hypothetical protein
MDIEYDDWYFNDFDHYDGFPLVEETNETTEQEDHATRLPPGERSRTVS